MFKAVIGGGISGLVWAAFHPEYTLFSEQLGGQLADSWMGPRLLNDNKPNRTLLKKLDLKAEPATCTVGYYVNGEVVEECPPDHKIMYYKKSRCLSGDVEVPSSTMSSGDNTIQHLKVDWEDLVSRLLDHIPNRVSENATTIENGKINGEYSYEEIIWTPPLPILFRLLGLEVPTFKALDKLFLSKSDFSDFDLKGYDYVYVPGPELGYHRVTKVKDNAVLEWTGSDMAHDPGDRCKLLKNAQLIPTEMDPYEQGIPSNIKLLGRMAEWNHKIKIEDVVKKSLSS